MSINTTNVARNFTTSGMIKMRNAQTVTDVKEGRAEDKALREMHSRTQQVADTFQSHLGTRGLNHAKDDADSRVVLDSALSVERRIELVRKIALETSYGAVGPIPATIMKSLASEEIENAVSKARTTEGVTGVAHYSESGELESVSAEMGQSSYWMELDEDGNQVWTKSNSGSGLTKMVEKNGVLTFLS